MSRLSDEELAKEAARWSTTMPPQTGWADATEAVPRSGESVPVTMRIPKAMLDILREFARREGIGYQVLVKRWLDERIRKEELEVRQRASVVVLHAPQVVQHAASFRPPASAALRQTHAQS